MLQSAKNRSVQSGGEHCVRVSWLQVQGPDSMVTMLWPWSENSSEVNGFRRITYVMLHNRV